MSAPSAHLLNHRRYNMQHRVKMSREPRAVRLNANLVILHYAQSCELNVKRKGSALSWQRSWLRRPTFLCRNEAPCISSRVNQFESPFIIYYFFINESLDKLFVYVSYNYNLFIIIIYYNYNI